MHFIKKKFIGVVVIFTISYASAAERLIFAVDLVRHGDRNPVEGVPKFYYEWKEGPGKLTLKGVQREMQLGRQLRKEYVEKYSLLPGNYQEGTLYVRSTDYSRTIGSAKSLLEGLYPTETRGGLTIPIQVVKQNDDALLLVRPSGNIFSVIKAFFAKRKLWKEKTRIIQNKLQHWSAISGLRIIDFDRLLTLADDLYIRQLNQISMPDGITSQDVQEVISLNEEATIAIFKMPEISEPTGKNIIAEISRYFQESVKKSSSLRWVLFSAHDATIMSVFSTLGIQFDQIPGFASRLNFTLWERMASSL